MAHHDFLARWKRDGRSVGVSRRRLIERAGAFGLAVPALGGLAFSARTRPASAQETEEYGVEVFSREFRVAQLPTFADGSVLFLSRRTLSKDDPIEDTFRPGSTLFFVESIPGEGYGYAELTHSAASKGTTQILTRNGDGYSLAPGTTTKLYEGDSALVIDATYKLECDTFEGAALLMSGLDSGMPCGGKPCP